jgi:hypothetical protein
MDVFKLYSNGKFISRNTVPVLGRIGWCKHTLHNYCAKGDHSKQRTTQVRISRLWFRTLSHAAATGRKVFERFSGRIAACKTMTNFVLDIRTWMAVLDDFKARVEMVKCQQQQQRRRRLKLLQTLAKRKAIRRTLLNIDEFKDKPNEGGSTDVMNNKTETALQGDEMNPGNVIAKSENWSQMINDNDTIKSITGIIGLENVTLSDTVNTTEFLELNAPTTKRPRKRGSLINIMIIIPLGVLVGLPSLIILYFGIQGVIFKMTRVDCECGAQGTGTDGATTGKGGAVSHGGHGKRPTGAVPHGGHGRRPTGAVPHGGHGKRPTGAVPHGGHGRGPTGAVPHGGHGTIHVRYIVADPETVDVIVLQDYY